MIPSTVGRVPEHTAEEVNERIRRQTERNLSSVSMASNAEVEERLRQLDREWDIERTLEANAALISLGGLALGAAVNRKWFLLPAVVAGFLFQHAVQGWCPPVPIFRRLGFRTQPEIEEERYALKALRGDFQGVSATAARSPDRASTSRALEAVRR
ncbi:MAG: hypothetical protein ACYC6N_17980 [Pirellulaceae bacterium]